MNEYCKLIKCSAKDAVFYKKGEVNMLYIILGLSPYADLADINGDQQVDVLDVIELVNIIMDL